MVRSLLYLIEYKHDITTSLILNYPLLEKGDEGGFYKISPKFLPFVKRGEKGFGLSSPYNYGLIID